MHPELPERERHAYVRCEECGGTGGWVPLDPCMAEECDVCMGTGLRKVSHPDGNLFVIGEVPDSQL